MPKEAPDPQFPPAVGMLLIMQAAVAEIALAVLLPLLLAG